MLRRARIKDVPEIRDLINSHAEFGRMLFRSMSNLYENFRDFMVYQKDDKVVGCCSMQTIWADLAELKSLAVMKEYQGQGIGRILVESIINQARELELPKIFTLTLEEGFFARMGFQKVSMDDLPMKVWSECVRCPRQDHCDEIAMIFML